MNIIATFNWTETIHQKDIIRHKIFILFSTIISYKNILLD
ncbi:protein of unknown function [Acidithiobacillus ferrivorans]|nr:protein of unknown function [Acidithiobacillus ferrivorans]